MFALRCVALRCVAASLVVFCGLLRFALKPLFFLLLYTFISPSWHIQKAIRLFGRTIVVNYVLPSYQMVEAYNFQRKVSSVCGVVLAVFRLNRVCRASPLEEKRL